MHGGHGAAAARTLDILELCGSHSQLCLNAFDVRAGERLQPTREQQQHHTDRQCSINAQITTVLVCRVDSAGCVEWWQ